MALGNRQRRRGSLFGWVSDVLDATHNYTDDWIDRIDDFEDEAREAVDDVVEDRYRYYDEGPRGSRRYYYDRPEERDERDQRDEPPTVEQGRGRMTPPAETEEIKNLKAKINTLAKQVEALLQQETTHRSTQPTAHQPDEEDGEVRGPSKNTTANRKKSRTVSAQKRK